MRTYEVFLRRTGKEGFSHAGSLDAPDDELALVLAREAYVRRGEGDEMWLVDRTHVLVGGPELLAGGGERSHRHNDGSVVAARRRERRQAAAESS
jgi:ring-1,2-phenylacetyl-CoA epoxidase subunit PaaB